ncbi:mitochondrial import receptor subunit TOM70 [Athalia rosae]|uniref:mitochondrial import receptor subunit TOM70 n=1 Tax=Athalia rosae TaxID=37344 RepID=UPI00203480B2|nr:mitochondrial import receptor subunit TOM70 [Athalia rosae]XP_048507441.1 mitochondrial import receptor subunit TOM70 [Athalia rosae]
MGASSGAGSISGSTLPKWQLALAVGAPVALGLGYMYYRNSSKSASRPRGKPKGGTGKENGTAKDKQLSVDGDDPSKVVSPPQPRNETPLEKATRYKNEGNDYFKSGKYDEAILSYNKAIETCPTENSMDLATFYQNRAAAYDHLKKYTAVKADCTKALELNPRYIKALQRRARALEHSREWVSVLEDVTAACILEQFSNQSTLMMADRVLKQLGRQHAKEHIENKKPVMPSKHFIRTYFSSFSNDPILTKLKESETMEPSTGYAKARQAMREEKYDDVISFCSEEIDRPEFVPESCMEVYLLRATFHLLLGRHTNAITDLQKIIESENSSREVKTNALIKRASMYMQLEDPDKCFLDFEKATEIYPECGDIYHHRGQVNLILEKVNDALEDFQKAVTLNPDFGIAFVQKCYTDYRYAILSKDKDKINKVLKDFEIAFEKFPDCVESYTLYAQVLCDSQDFAKADSYFAKALQRDPNNANVYVHRGLLQLQWNGNINKAIEYINKALKLDNKCEFGYETLGTIEVQRGNLKEAIELFDQALALGRTEMELSHIFSLRDAAKAQLTVTERLGLDLSTLSSLQGIS